MTSLLYDVSVKEIDDLTKVLLWKTIQNSNCQNEKQFKWFLSLFKQLIIIFVITIILIIVIFTRPKNLIKILASFKRKPFSSKILITNEHTIN